MPRAVVTPNTCIVCRKYTALSLLLKTPPTLKTVGLFVDHDRTTTIKHPVQNTKFTTFTPMTILFQSESRMELQIFGSRGEVNSVASDGDVILRAGPHPLPRQPHPLPYRFLSRRETGVRPYSRWHLKMPQQTADFKGRKRAMYLLKIYFDKTVTDYMSTTLLTKNIDEFS